MKDRPAQRSLVRADAVGRRSGADGGNRVLDEIAGVFMVVVLADQGLQKNEPLG